MFIISSIVKQWNGTSQKPGRPIGAILILYYQGSQNERAFTGHAAATLNSNGLLDIQSGKWIHSGF
jgi:hypothetical protein